MDTTKPETNLLQSAQGYVKRGFSVIPLKPKSKEPIITSWKEYQERYPTDEELASWFNGSQNNIAIVCGQISGLAIVDLDSDEAIRFKQENNFPITPTVKTGKGYHLYYAYPPDRKVRNFQARDDLPDIHLRGEGGYVVAPPSIHPNGTIYQWLPEATLDLPLAPLPTILLINDTTEKTPLKELYKGVDEGERNTSLTRLVGSWASDGLTLDECLENAMLMNSKNKPPLPEKEIRLTVQSIFELHRKTNSQAPIKEDINPLSCMMKWNDFFTLNIHTEYLLEKLIPKGGITLLFSRGGMGKTSLMLQISRAIAEGIPFAELQTLQTPVYYIDFENPLTFLKERVEKIGTSDNLYVWHISNNPMPPRLDSKTWDIYKRLPPGLIIFDTLRAGHLLDENNSKDMALIVARLKELREIGFTILLLHHTPKGNEGIYKGSTAILDLTDHVLALEILKETDDDVEFDPDKSYRFSTRIKTRYEPYSIYLTFNPEIKGFELAKDPDMEKMRAIQELIQDSKESMKQKDLKERIKDELGYTERDIRRLLKKGIDTFWKTSTGEKNSILYSVCTFVQPYKDVQTDQQDLLPAKTCTNTPLINTSKTIDNIEMVRLLNGSVQTDKQDDFIPEVEGELCDS